MPTATTVRRWEPTFAFDEKAQLWTDDYNVLLSLGYQLRPRYYPDWTPSWRSGKQKGFYEDSLTLVLVKDVLDAVRVKDGRKVVIKRMATGSEEHKIIAHLSSGSQLSDPRNRIVPVLDIITHTQDPSISFVVMPFARRFSHPPFHCRAEFAKAIRQYIEGLQFMHEQKISHFDIAVQNMVMDEPPVVPNGSHFARPSTHRGSFGLFSWRKRCSVGPLNYWYIDFGNSDLYPEGTEKARTLGLLRNCKEIQELSNTVPYNPFKVDVCQLGIVILEVIKPYPGLELFRALGDSMSSPHPDDRPDPTAALAHLDKIVQGLDPRTLRASIWQ
ncbi:kinase-like domain-containing protein [Mycena rebaudengoi]|nr:kinase-like domain-containing protein [Mycena rebaudengoi]